MKRLPIIMILALLLFTCWNSVTAQETKQNFKSYLYLGINAGPNLFKGDVKQYRFYPVTQNKNEWTFAVAGHLGYQFTPVFGLRGQLLYGKISGTKRSENLHFNADLLEGNLIMTFHINELFNHNPNRFFNIIAFAGAGMVNYKTRLEHLQTGVVIREWGYKDGGIVGSSYIGTVPAGFIFDLKLSRTLKLNIETAIHIANIDVLDNLKRDFPYDMYYYNAIGLTYQIKGKKKEEMPPEDKTEPLTDEDEGQKDELAEGQEPGEDAGVKDGDDQQMQGQQQVEPVLVPMVVETDDRRAAKDEEAAAAAAKIGKDGTATGEDGQVMYTHYSVQIHAIATGTLNLELFRNKYGFDREIEHHMHKGNHIYTTGRYKTYKEAQAARDIIINQYGIMDAFVVKFVDGERLNRLRDERNR